MYLHTSAGAESKLLLSSLFGGGNIYIYIYIDPSCGKTQGTCLFTLSNFLHSEKNEWHKERKGGKEHEGSGEHVAGASFFNRGGASFKGGSGSGNFHICTPYI